jgi:hypothetical protein
VTNRNLTAQILPIKELLLASPLDEQQPVAGLEKLCFLVIWEEFFFFFSILLPYPSQEYLLASAIHTACIIKY